MTDMSTLADTLTANSLKAVSEGIIKSLNVQVDVRQSRLDRVTETLIHAQTEVEQAQDALDSAVTARDVVKKALEGVVPSTPNRSDKLFYVASRSGTGDGHFIDLSERTCSCKGFEYRSHCWAYDLILDRLKKKSPTEVYRYPSSPAEFDSRVRPPRETWLSRYPRSYSV